MIDKYSATWIEVARVAQEAIDKTRKRVESSSNPLSGDELHKAIGRIQSMQQILILDKPSDE